MIRKNIIITAGPTNEPIDHVMQITNMSSGRLGAVIADTFLKEKNQAIGTVYYICHKRAVLPETIDPRIEIIKVNTTDDMLDAITRVCNGTKIDIIVHTAAVGDYKSEYVVKAKDLATEIATEIFDAINQGEITRSDILNILRHPKCICDNDTKISSSEPDLMCKFALTEKIIRYLHSLAPDATLVGCKLLSNVTTDKLISVAKELLEKNHLDYVIANDLQDVTSNSHKARIIDKQGFWASIERSKEEIAQRLTKLLF